MITHINQWWLKRKLLNLFSQKSNLFDWQHIHCKINQDSHALGILSYRIELYCFSQQSALRQNNHWYLIGQSRAFANRLKAEQISDSWLESWSREILHCQFYKRQYYPDLDMEGEDRICMAGIWTEHVADLTDDGVDAPYEQMSIDELLLLDEHG